MFGRIAGSWPSQLKGMDLDENATRIFQCPICQVDTPHRVFGQRNGIHAALCLNCRSGALVRAEALRLAERRWEGELCEILSSLIHPSPPDHHLME